LSATVIKPHDVICMIVRSSSLSTWSAMTVHLTYLTLSMHLPYERLFRCDERIDLFVLTHVFECSTNELESLQLTTRISIGFHLAAGKLAFACSACRPPSGQLSTVGPMRIKIPSSSLIPLGSSLRAKSSIKRTPTPRDYNNNYSFHLRTGESGHQQLPSAAIHSSLHFI